MAFVSAGRRARRALGGIGAGAPAAQRSAGAAVRTLLAGLYPGKTRRENPCYATKGRVKLILWFLKGQRHIFQAPKII